MTIPLGAKRLTIIVTAVACGLAIGWHLFRVLHHNYPAFHSATVGTFGPPQLEMIASISGLFGVVFGLFIIAFGLTASFSKTLGPLLPALLIVFVLCATLLAFASAQSVYEVHHPQQPPRDVIE